MEEEVQKEEKYLVIKKDDMEKYLTWTEQTVLNIVITKIITERSREGKRRNKYVMCNQDEPYSEAVWLLILEGERNKKEAK